MILIIIVLLFVLPDILRAEDRRQAAEDLQRQQAEKAEAARIRQADAVQRRMESDRKRAEAEDRRQAAARSVIEFYEPRRREFKNRRASTNAHIALTANRLQGLEAELETEQNPQRVARLQADADRLRAVIDQRQRERLQLDEKIFQIERKLEAAYWTLQGRD